MYTNKLVYKIAPLGLLFVTQKERFPSTVALTLAEQSLRHPAS